MNPSTLVIVDSHASDDVQRIVVWEHERSSLRNRWELPDPLITRLNHLPWIGGEASSWSELTRVQLQTLIAMHLTMRHEHPEHEEIVAIGLMTAITALIICLEEDTGWVTQLRINHLGDFHLEVDVSLTIGAKMEPVLRPKKSMRVVVDNTTE